MTADETGAGMSRVAPRPAANYCGLHSPAPQGSTLPVYGDCKVPPGSSVVSPRQSTDASRAWARSLVRDYWKQIECLRAYMPPEDERTICMALTALLRARKAELEAAMPMKQE